MNVTRERLILLATFILTLCVAVQCADGDVNEDKKAADQDDTTEGEWKKPSPIEKYRMRFLQYRGMQAQIMQTVFQKAGKERMDNLITGMVVNLFKIMMDAKENLTKVGYVPGDEFPEDLETKESLSKVMENIFMFGDVLLRWPTFVHVLFDVEQPWKDSLLWAYHVCSKSGIFDASQQQFLDLLAMEAGILPKDANFMNPYLDESEKPRKKFEEPKPVEKKKPKKKIKRGPRLSHTEL